MNIRLLKRRSAAIAATLVSAGLVLGACSSDDSDDAATDTRTVETSLGSVEVPANPERVAILGDVPAFLELGGKPVVVTEMGESQLAELSSDQQAAYEDAVAVGYDADAEKVAESKPDVIIFSCFKDTCEEMREKYSSIAPSVPMDVETDWQDRVLSVALSTGREAELQEQRESFDGKVSEIRENYGTILKDRKFVEASRWDGQDPGLFTIDGTTCADVLIDEGLIEYDEYQVEASFEKIGDLSKYDAIFYSGDSDGGPADFIDSMISTDAWKFLPAVKSGNAQPVYCPSGRSYNIATKYLDNVGHALAAMKDLK